MAKIGHCESIWTTLVGKYWKSCKQLKLAIPHQFEPLHYENIIKVEKWAKLAVLNQFGLLW